MLVEHFLLRVSRHEQKSLNPKNCPNVCAVKFYSDDLIDYVSLKLKFILLMPKKY